MGRIKDRHVSAVANIDPSKIRGGLAFIPKYNAAKVLYVDGDNGLDTLGGLSPLTPMKTIQAAVTAAGAWGTVMVFAKDMAVGATDPGNYAETVIIPATHEGLTICGISGYNRTQGGLPQMNIGAGSTAMINVKAPGCTIMNMGINGASSTGGGIKLSDDGGSTMTSFGTSIINCHFKNCKTHATQGSSGGGVYTTAYPPWQVRIEGCHFYKCTNGIAITGSTAVAQDWVIENCTFSASVATDVDGDIYIYNCLGLVVKNCAFNCVDVPSKASGDLGRYIKCGAGTFGMISDCTFACITNESETEISFGATGTGGIIPATVRMVRNFGETSTAGTMESGEIFRMA